MFHVVLIGLAVAVAVFFWAVVQRSPWVLSLFLPRTLMFAIGAALFIAAFFAAFAAAYELRHPEVVLRCFVQAFVGLWFMFAPTASLRGTYEDEVLRRNVFAMTALLMAVIIATLYVSNPQVVALMNLGLIMGGFLIVRRHLRTLS